MWVNDNHADPSSYIGIVNKIGSVMEIPKPVPKWETILRSKLTSADEWADVITSRINHGKSVDSIEQYFGELIEKLGGTK